MKVLIIEDEKALSASIFTYLNSEQYICEIASDYHSAMTKVGQYDYACIILDINLPGGSGLEILKELKAGKKAEGVLIISARNSLDDRLNGLNSGADDYLSKPFHLSELAARVEHPRGDVSPVGEHRRREVGRGELVVPGLVAWNERGRRGR